MKTEIQELTTEIHRLQKENELKTGWIALLSHDFKEIFGSLLWMTDAVENESISKDDFFKLLPRIKQDAKKNLQTVTDTSDWLKTQMNRFEPQNSKLFAVDLFIQLRNEFKEKLNDKKIDFQFLGDENLVFHNDDFLVFFILKKLLHNAIKYSHTAKTIHFKAFEDHSNTILSIRDYGVGMEAKSKESLFSFQSPVFQGTKGEIGSGLSLKIVRNFVSLMHGEIEVESAENVSTTIAIILPKIEK